MHHSRFLYHKFVVTGTHTGVGKTLVSAILSAAADAYYWKPVQAGADPDHGTDLETVARLWGLPTSHPRLLPSTYHLRESQSPHFAAEAEGVVIDPDRLTVPDTNGEFLMIEGAGGVLVPLNRQMLYADLFARWQVPVIVVSGLYLGAINHTLMTLEALRSRNVPIHGLIWSGGAYPAVQDVIANFDPVRILGHLPVIDAHTLQTADLKVLTHLYNCHMPDALRYLP